MPVGPHKFIDIFFFLHSSFVSRYTSLVHPSLIICFKIHKFGSSFSVYTSLVHPSVCLFQDTQVWLNLQCVCFKIHKFGSSFSVFVSRYTSLAHPSVCYDIKIPIYNYLLKKTTHSLPDFKSLCSCCFTKH